MADNPYMKLADQDTVTPTTTAAPQADNPYMGLAKQDLEQTQQQIRGILDVVSPINPDEAAEATKLSRTSGLPEQTVQDNLAEVKRRERVRMLDLQRVLAESPVLARQLMDPNFAKIAQDNVEPMVGIEKAASYLGRSLGSGLLNLTAAGLKLTEAALPYVTLGAVQPTSEEELAVLFKNDPAKLKDMRENGAATALSRWALDLQKQADAVMANAPDAVKREYGNLEYLTTDTDKAAYMSPVKLIGDAVQSLPTTLALMYSMYITKSAAGNTYSAMMEAGATREVALKEASRVAAESMAKYSAVSEGVVGYAQQANQTRAEADKITDEQLKTNPEYWNLIDKEGFSPEAARIYLSAKAANEAGTFAGLVDAVTNFYGGRVLGKVIGEGGALLPRTGKGFATEALTEAPQSMGEQFGSNLAIQENLNRDQSLGQGVGEAGAAGFFVGGLTGGGFSAAIGGIQQRDEQASNANVVFNLLNQLNTLAGADLVRQRDVQTFANFMQAVENEQGGPVNTLYISPKTLLENLTAAGVDVQQVIATVPSLANLPELAQNDTEVAIPVSDFATHIAGSDYAQAIMPHLKADPNGMSKVEADEYMKNHGEQVKAEVERVLAEQEGKTEFKASMDKVKADIKAQLDETKRFTSDVNEAYSTLMAAFYATTGAKIGLSPEEMATKYPIKITAEGVSGGQEYDQSGQLKTETDSFKNWFKQSKLVDESGKPMVLYRGMSGEAMPQDGVSEMRPTAGLLGTGIYMTGSTKRAEGYTKGENGQTYPLYVSIQNPISEDDFVERFGKGKRSAEENQAITDQLISEGYDGVISQHGNNVWEVVAFNPSQVKSVFNNGEFNPNDANILNQSYDQQVESTEDVIADQGGEVKDSMQIDQLIDSKDIPIITLKDMIGMSIFPTIADRTAAATLYTGIDSSQLQIAIPLLGGPFFPLRLSNVLANVVWANRGDGVVAQKAAKLKEGANYMLVVMGDADMHQSNSTVAAAFMGTLEAWARDGRITPENVDALGKLVREIGAKAVDDARVKLDAADAAVAAATDEKSLKKAKKERSQAQKAVTTNQYLENFTGFDDISLSHAYMDGISFDARKRILEIMASKQALDLGAPPMARILEATREPSLAGHRWGDGVLLVEVDQTNPQVELGTEGTTPHPDFPVGVRGKIVGKLNAPINWQLLWQDWLKENEDKDSPRRAFELSKPIVNVTEDLVSRIGEIKQENIDSARQARLASDFAANNWSTSDEAVKQGGVSPQEFLDALANSAAATVLSQPTLADVKAGIKDKSLKLFQLGSDGQIYFALKQGNPNYATDYGIEIPEIGDNEVLLTSVVNNEAGARGIAAPAVVLKALQEGATVLDCFGVKSDQYPDGFLPALYEAFGFKKVAEVPFDPLYYSQQKLNDAVKYWKDSTKGYDPETHGYPPLVIMKWSGTDEDRANITERYLRGGVASILAGRADADVGAFAAEFGPSDQAASVEGDGADTSGTGGDQTASAGGFVASRARGTVQGIANLTDNELTNLGLTAQDRDAVRSALGLSSYNQGEQAPRGKISFGNDITQTPSVITLLKAANLSTFLHESGHFFLEVNADIASRPDAPAEIVQDMQKILDWFGVEDLQTWRAMDTNAKRPYHEQFARGFEAYLFEGKSPSVELQGVFQRFRSWLVNIYKQLSGLNVHLDDEIRGVFDRMLASSEAIVEAEQARSFTPLFTSKPPFMTDEEWLAYQQTDMQSSQDAVQELETKSVRDMQWLSNAKSRLIKAMQKENAELRKEVRREVEGEVMAEPVYRAREFFKRGTLDGQPVESPVKLSIPEIEAMYEGNPILGLIKKQLGFGKYGMLGTENGMHPEQAAELFGFTSGDHLIRSLLEAPDPRTVIDQRTDQRMLERYGDINSPQSLSRAADEAIHNDARARFVATEANALAKAVGKPKLVTQAAKKYAEQIINRLKIRNIKAGQYAASAARAGREAAKSTDLVEQATAKRNQLINTFAAKAAYAAQDEVIRGVRYLQKFNSKNIYKTVHVDYLEQIQALLDRFDLRSSTTLKQIDRKRSLEQWVKLQQEKGEEPVVPQELLDENYRVSYKEMTLEDFRGLIDTIRNIEHLGRLKDRLIKIQDQREFKAVSGQAAETIRENATGSIDDQLEQKGLKNAVATNGREVLAWHRKFASLIRQMDGFKDGGALWSIFVKPMNEAGTQEASMREQATVKLAELYKLLKGVNFNKKEFIPEIGNSLTMEGRLAIALNMGNETNMRRVLEGENWTPEQVQAILRPLTREHWNFVQGVWDLLNSYWPEIAAKERRMTGIVPEKVEARSFVATLEDGTKIDLAGGYYPIKYNSARSSKAAADSAADVLNQMQRGLYARAQTARGHIESRMESVGRPMRYDLGVIDQHLNQVIHDLSWHEYLVDANRLLRADSVDAAIREHYGPEVLKVMTKTMEDIAIGELPSQSSIERGVRYVRTGVSIASMGWNLITAFTQPLGLTQSMVRIGPKWVAKGLGRWLRDASSMESTVQWVGEKSEFMRLRAKTMQREISEIRNTISKGETMSAVEGSFFYLIGKMQLVADIPTWVGMYEKAMAEGNNEDRAIALADQAVLDSQGGGQIKDLSMVQKGGEWQKLWTNFYSFFNVTYNQLAESIGETQKVGASRLPLLAVDFLMLTVVPATLGYLLKAAVKGTLGDDDEDELMKKLLAENVSFLMGLMVGTREVGSALMGTMGYEGPAGARFFADVAKFAKQVNQGEADEAFWRSANELGGVLLHYPALQLDRTVRGIMELSEDGENPLAALFGPKPKK